MKLNVTLIKHPTTPYWVSLKEFAESVYYRLKHMGHDAVFSHGIEEGRKQIVIGAHNILGHPTQDQVIAPDAIIYNIEQLHAIDWAPQYIEKLQKFTVWEYAPSNMDILSRAGISAHYTPIGYVPEMTLYPPSKAPEYDVCFIGTLNDRRRECLQALFREGMRVYFKNAVYGAERDLAAANSKICLNVHYYVPAIFEIQRVSYWLANQCFVVSEDCGRQEYFNEPDGKGGIVYTPYTHIVDTCLKYVQDEEARRKIAAKGFESVKTLDVSEYLKKALENL